jgi:multiple sugar transport system ATP-binding protein
MRPEDLEDAALVPDTADGRRLRADLEIREDMGPEVFLHFRLDVPPVSTDEVREAVGEEAIEAQQAGRGAAFIARADRETRAREGAPLELYVNAERLHFFDPASEEGIYEDHPDAGASGAPGH